MLENINLKDVSEDKVRDLCKRFDELSVKFDEDKVVDVVLDDFNFGYCMEEEIYTVFDYWKKDKKYKETHRKLKMYCVDISDEGSEFELRFEVNGKIVDRKTTYCFDDILYYSHDFFSSNCDKIGFDGRFDELEINISYKYY